MPDRGSQSRRRVSHQTVVAIAAPALAAFLVLLVVLTAALRQHPPALSLVSHKPRIVVVRRVYETVVHERVIGASGASGPAATTTSSSSVASVAPLPTPVTTRTS